MQEEEAGLALGGVVGRDSSCSRSTFNEASLRTTVEPEDSEADEEAETEKEVEDCEDGDNRDNEGLWSKGTGSWKYEGEGLGRGFPWGCLLLVFILNNNQIVSNSSG